MKIGFIGTGTMGQPMLANLVKKGFSIVAYDVVPARAMRTVVTAPVVPHETAARQMRASPRTREPGTGV